MLYAKIKNKKIVSYPYVSLYKDYPNVSFPNPLTEDVLSQYDVCIVHETTQPECKWDQIVEEDKPKFDNQKWIQTWKVSNIDTEKRKQLISNELENIKSKRNKLLADCDWTQLADASLTQKDKDAWAEYRKQLRDLPNKSSVIKNPFSVKWPSAPNAKS